MVVIIGFLRKTPNRTAKPKKGQKKQGIWPTKLNFGFLNNKKKSKRPFTNKKSAPKRPFSKPSLEVVLSISRNVTDI